PEGYQCAEQPLRGAEKPAGPPNAEHGVHPEDEGTVADVRNQCLRLVLEPLLVSEERKDDHHRCTDQMVIEVTFEDARLGQSLHESVHGLLLLRVGRHLDIGGTAANRLPSPSAIVGCARMASRNTVWDRPPSIAVCTAATTSPASVPSIVKPRMRSPDASTSTFMKPAVSPVVWVRNTALIGSFATRTAIPCSRASRSVMPTRASGGALNKQKGMSPAPGGPLPPPRLSPADRASAAGTRGGRRLAPLPVHPWC